MLLDQPAGLAVDEDQRRLHGRQIELGAAEIGMRLDAAIGDRECASVRHQQQLVRVHAVGRELADAAKAVGGVVDADHARGGLEVVLGRVEQLAVGREHSVAEEMPSLDARDGQRRLVGRMVEDDGEGAWPAGEDHGRPVHGVEGDVMAALGQVDREQHLAGLGEQRHAIGAVATLERGGEDGIGLLDRGAGRRRQGRGEAGARGLQEMPSVDRAACQSPSSEEKPAVRPSSADSRPPNCSERLDVTMPK